MGGVMNTKDKIMNRIKKMGREAIIVTRHPALAAYLREQFPFLEKAPVVPHADAQMVAEKVVFGVLPLSLAALARAVVVIPLNVPFEMRGKELDLKTVREFAREPELYEAERKL